jgi:hypothetical protein
LSSVLLVASDDDLLGGLCAGTVAVDFSDAVTADDVDDADADELSL